jgi:NTE family protein
MAVKEKPYKLGLALSGGGAKGFAHVGVFKLLEECRMKPDIISGTSAGALAGCFYADGYTSEEIKHIFMGKEFSEFAKIQIPKDGLFDNSRLTAFIRKHLHAKRIEDLEIPLAIIATDLDRGVSHEFRNGSIAEAVTASCSVPIIFSPVEIGGIHYVDGGLFRNFPVTNIREECEKIIGVNVSPLVTQKYKHTIFHIAERSYHYMFRANTTEDRQLCDLLIETEEFDEYKMFDLENTDEIIRIGYGAAIRAFQNLVDDSKFNQLVRKIKSKSTP